MKNVKGKNFVYLLLCWIAILLLFSGCSNTKYLTKDQSLHNATKIKLETETEDGEKYEGTLKKSLYALTRPKPNRKLAGAFRFRLWVYNRTKDNEKGFRKWLNKKVGDPPVLLDSTQLERSTKVIESHLFNKGYFNHEVGFSTTTKKQKSTVTYDVKVFKPYRIAQVIFPKDSIPITKVMRQIKESSLLKTKDRFDTDQLNKERDRITSYLRNRGYYDFNRNIIEFDLDSSKTNHTIDIHLRLKPLPDHETHKVYSIGNIYVFPQDGPDSKPSNYYADTVLVDDIQFITPTGEKRFKPKMISDFLLIDSGKLFSQKHYNYAINHLYELGVYKFVNIKFEKVPPQTLTDSLSNKRILDCYIYCTPSKKMSFTIEAELNSRTGNAIGRGLLGNALSLTYRNKSAFKAAELFSFNVHSGFEFQLNKDAPLINTFDISGEASLAIPKFFPFKFKNVSRYYRPRTHLTLGIEFVRRLGFYTLSSNSLSFGWDWRESARKRHIVNPIAISLVNLLDVSDDFQTSLDENILLAKSFEERIILGSTYTYLYNNQKVNSLKNFIFFRGHIDISGNLFYAFEQFLKGINVAENDLTIFGNTYSQYTRLEADFRHYKSIKGKSRLISRVATSIGMSYGNSDVLPFIKQYQIGGPNSLRAFDVRTIGPGSFGAATVDTSVTTISEFDRTGDIKIELNLEYRFPIFSVVKGALFTDIGNVWLLREQTEIVEDEVVDLRPGGNFSKDFWKEFGIGWGFGFRMDFGYFVFRFDVASPLRDPTLPDGDRWKLAFKLFEKQWRQNNLNLNLAIGYPF